MFSSSKKIIVDNYFKRYFDLGTGFNDDAYHHLQGSVYALTEWVSKSLLIHDKIYCRRVAEKIHEFVSETPWFGLQVISEDDRDFSVVIDNLRYKCISSRFDLLPASADRRVHVPVTIPEALPAEFNRCYESGIELLMDRTGIVSLPLAFEAIRMGKANLPH
jgi:virulence-associated protein VapD